MKLSQKIRNARLNLSTKLGYQISQAEFGRMCGWKNAQSRCSNYETGNRAPSLEDLLKIIAVSGVSPAEFFDPEELQGMQMDHVEKAFDKVSAEAAIPKSVFRTRYHPDVTNSIAPFMLDPKGPLMKGDFENQLSGFLCDGVAHLVDHSKNKIKASGLWMLLIGSDAVPTRVKAMPDGSMVSEDYGVLDLKGLTVLGRVVLMVSSENC